MSEKQKVWLIQNPESGFPWCVIDFSHIADWIEADLEGADEDETVEFHFKYKMMTQEELDALWYAWYFPRHLITP